MSLFSDERLLAVGYHKEDTLLGSGKKVELAYPFLMVELMTGL